MLIPCQCCGCFADCERCDDPKVHAHIQHLLWETDLDPDAEENGGHLHLCGICEEAGCTFGDGPGGERCYDNEPLIEDEHGNFENH